MTQQRRLPRNDGARRWLATPPPVLSTFSATSGDTDPGVVAPDLGLGKFADDREQRAKQVHVCVRPRSENLRVTAKIGRPHGCSNRGPNKQRQGNAEEGTC